MAAFYAYDEEVEETRTGRTDGWRPECAEKFHDWRLRG